MWTKKEQSSAVTAALSHVASAIKNGSEPGYWPGACPLKTLCPELSKSGNEKGGGCTSGNCTKAMSEEEKPMNEATEINQESSKVRVTDLDMPFWSMVIFMVKWAIAAIPAVLVLGICGAIIAVLLGAMGLNIGRHGF